MAAADPSDVKSRLCTAFAWRGDRGDEYADVTGWWRDPALLRLLGPALAQLFPEATPTVILGPDSRGSLIGPLVAVHLKIGFVEVRKDRTPAGDSDQWIRRRRWMGRDSVASWTRSTTRGYGGICGCVLFST